SCTAAVTLPITQRSISTTFPGTPAVEDAHQYTYDGYGNILTEVDYDFGAPPHGALIGTTTITYASLGTINAFRQTMTVTDSNSAIVSKTNYNYDETGTTGTTNTPQHVAITGSRGNLTSVNLYTSASNYLTKKSTYYDTGNTNVATDVNSATTTYAYGTGSCGNSFATGTTNSPSSLTSSATWNCTGGVVTSITDANGKATNIAYVNDKYFWRPDSVADPTNATMYYCYGLNNTSGTCTPNPNQIESYLTFTSGSTNVDVDSLITVDALGRTNLQQTRQGSGLSGFDTVETDFDALGRVAKVSLPFSGSAGTTNPSANGTTTSYDALNRVIQTQDSGGGIVAMSYPQNDTFITVKTAPTGENNKRRQLEYNSIGQLTSVCEVTSVLSGNGTCAQSSPATGYWTKYTYTPLGQITGVTQNAQATPQTRSYVYDLMGRLTSETNPESGTRGYIYDSGSRCAGSYTSYGDMIETNDAAGNCVDFYYDSLHRTIAIGSTSGGCKHFYYDNTNGVLGSRPSGVTINNSLGHLIEAEVDNCSWPITQSAIISDEWFSYTTRGETNAAYEYTQHTGGNYYQTNASYW